MSHDNNEDKKRIVQLSPITRKICAYISAFIFIYIDSIQVTILLIYYGI